LSGLTISDLKLDVGGFSVEVRSLEITEGRRLVLFGPNGAGKTTLLRFLAGEPRWSNRPLVSYLPQRPWAFRGSVERCLGLGLDAVERRRAREHAAAFSVGYVLDRRLRSLSGGERQKIALARVLARPEPVVLLDEPLNAIDRIDRPLVARHIVRALGGRTAVIVTHDREEAAMLGDEVAVMANGRIRQTGSVDSVFAMPLDEEVAAIVGVANVLAGDVTQVGGGLAAVRFGEIEIWGVGELPPGASAAALFGGETVTVHAGRHATPGSARNRWPGRIESMGPLGRLIEVLVDVGGTVVALLTPGSVDALGLRPGAHVTLTVKASAVRIVPR
jgi:molybdate transport system ATP-binding protein